MTKVKPLVPKLRFPAFRGAGEWKIKKLEETLLKNSTKNRSRKYKLVQSVSNKHGFINQDKYFEKRKVASKDTSNYYVIKKGYFAYNPSRIDVGSLAYKFDDEASVISPLYVSFKANNKEIIDKFLLNWFSSESFISQMIFEGGVRNTFSYKDLIQVKIKLPKLEEQQKIADCLSSLDALIEAQSQKLAALKEHKKGLMQQLFPQGTQTTPRLRFPAFQNAGAWEVKLLGANDFATLHKGKGIAKSDISPDGKIPCIRYGELYTHYGEVIKTPLSRTNASTSKLFFSQENDVIIPSSGETKNDIATASCVMANGIALGSDLNVIRSNHNGVFISYYMNGALKRKIAKIAQGDSVVHLYPRQLEKIEIFIPSSEEQQRIADCLSSLDALIEAQSQKLKALKKEHKKGLMQQLFPSLEGR